MAVLTPMGRDIPQDHLLLEAGRAEKRLARVRRDAAARHAISGRAEKQERQVSRRLDE